MKVFALCLIALVCANGLQMYEKYPGLVNFGKKRSIMNVMAQVEEQLKANGPMDAITRVLDEYKEEIHAEQLAHDQLYERQTKECNEEFEFRQGEVEEAVSALKEASETLDGARQQQQRAKSDLAITKKQLKQKTAELIHVHTVRKLENYDFDTWTGAYTIIHPAIQVSIEYIDELFGENGAESFVQLAKHTNKLIVQAVQMKQAHHMQGVLAIMAEMSTSAEVVDTALVDQLKALFTQLLAKMEAEYAAAVEAEEAAVAKYNADVERLETIIENLKAQQAALEFEIADLDKVIITQLNIVASATQKKDRNERLYKDAVKMCHMMDKQYESAKAGRAAELELLAAIKVKVDEHFAKFSEGVVKRGELDNFDNTYTNESEYVKPEFTPKF